MTSILCLFLFLFIQKYIFCLSFPELKRIKYIKEILRCRETEVKKQAKAKIKCNKIKQGEYRKN